MSPEENGAEFKIAWRSEVLKKLRGAVREGPIEAIDVDPSILRRWSRRDLLLFGAAGFATLVGGGSQLPGEVLRRLGVGLYKNESDNRWLLNAALRLDDNVSAALYSEHHVVPTYTKSQITPLKNNYNGATPDPSYIPEWRVTLDGPASRVSVSFDIPEPAPALPPHGQDHPVGGRDR